MENREILIAVTTTQKRYKVVTNVKTLGELKGILDKNENVLVKQGNTWVENDYPIDYTNLSFLEAYSNTELLSNDSQLPTNVENKGVVTNNLVIILTNTKKNISSGMGTRKEAYEAIATMNLQDEIKKTFGKNYTQVKTEDLWSIISKYQVTRDNTPNPNENENDENDENTSSSVNTIKECIINDICCLVIDILNAGSLSIPEVISIVTKITSALDSLTDKGSDLDIDSPSKETEEGYSDLLDDETEELINRVSR